MKNLKKVLALVLVCAMFFTVSSFAFSDVDEDASYFEAVAMLSKLGIINGYEDGTFLPDNTITRAEVATVLVNALGAADQAQGMTGNNTFTDVPSTHWAAGYVNYAANFGVIAGRGNGIFDPEAPVTYEETVKMIVAMLGYTPVANVKGGYPTGYLYVANNMIKITKGATGSVGDPAKRWVVARLLFNALDAKIMEQSSWSASDPDYVQGNQTLLKDYLEVTKIEGIVTETFQQNEINDKEDQDITIELSSIDGYTSQSKLDDSDNSYSYEIGDEYTVDANGTGAEDYLGYKVLAYVKEFDEGDDELVAIAPISNKNNTLEVAFDDFVKTTNKAGVDDKSSKNISFEYYADSSSDTVLSGKIFKKGADEAIWYKNGNLQNDLEDLIANLKEFGPDYDQEDGFVKFLDNNGDNVYDVIFVETIGNEYVVDEITAKTYKITDKISNGSIKLDPTADDMYVTFYKDNAQVDFDEIEEDDVLSIVYNGSTLKNSSVIKVYISSDKVEGYVSTASEAKNEYKIGGTVYSKSIKCDAIKRSDEGTFFLNYKGRIAYADATMTAGGNYAFLLSVNTEDSFSDGKSYTLRFMNEKGEWIDADLYDRVTFIYYDEEGKQNSYRTKELDEIQGNANKKDIGDYTNNWLKISGDDLVLAGALEQRVFQYTLNSEGAITKIVLPSEGLTEDNFSVAEFTEAEYDGGNNRFKSITRKGGVDESTVVFAIDVDSDDVKDVTKKKEVSLTSYKTFKDEQKYSGYVYDFDDDVYKCMILTKATNAIDDEASLLVVSSIELTAANDKDYLVINGYMDGEKVELESVEDADVVISADNDVYTVEDLENLEVGDVIEVACDASGKVTDIKVVYANGKLYDGTNDKDDDGIYYAKGFINSKKVSGTAKSIELANYDGAEWKGFIDVVTAGSGMKGNIYNVNLNGKKHTVDVDDSIADYLGTLSDDLDDMEGNDVCFAVVKLYDGDTIDIVVYTVKYAEASLD